MFCCYEQYTDLKLPTENVHTKLCALQPSKRLSATVKETERDSGENIDILTSCPLHSVQPSVQKQREGKIELLIWLYASKNRTFSAHFFVCVCVCVAFVMHI